MELSGIVKQYNVPLTHDESNLMDRLPGETSELTEQRIRNLAAARDVLKQMPDRQTSERRSRMEKIAMLKERLKMLRQMLAFLSPSAAKSLKSEMKQIAGQIASLSADGGGGGSAILTLDMPSAETTGFTKPAEAAPDTAVTTKEGQENSKNQQKNQTEAATELSGQKPDSNAVVNAEERALRESVAELKSLFKTVLDALKRKQKKGHTLRSASPLRAYLALPENGGSLTITV